MCASEKYIKLCSCGNAVSGNKTWRLVRGNACSQMVGEFFPPKEQHQEFKLGIYLQQKILTDLNNEDVFDFDYEKIDGDVLIISLNNQEYHYVFSAGKFYIKEAASQLESGTGTQFGSIKLTQ